MPQNPASRPVKVPRPRNGFILYRSYVAGNLPPCPLGTKRKQHEISQLAGALWRNETPDVKARFKAQAEVLKAEHHAKYPDFTYATKGKQNALHEPTTTISVEPEYTLIRENPPDDDLDSSSPTSESIDLPNHWDDNLEPNTIELDPSVILLNHANIQSVADALSEVSMDFVRVNLGEVPGSTSPVEEFYDWTEFLNLDYCDDAFDLQPPQPSLVPSEFHLNHVNTVPSSASEPQMERVFTEHEELVLQLLRTFTPEQLTQLTHTA
ncbi:hypothetical protein H0H93_014567 [Arthromyces matolae]|nr:hypothetical protein H0H93_014567 [Arthromyces matolae]